MLAGGFAYGLPAVPDHPTATSDTYPSMMIAAADCVREGNSDSWLHANYHGIRGWAESMLATDSDGNGSHQVRRQRQLRHVAGWSPQIQAIQLVGHHRLRP